MLGRKIYTFLNKKWFFDKIYNEFFSQFFFRFSYDVSYKAIDRGAFEIMGPSGLSAVISNVAYKLHKAQTGSLYHYALTILAIFTFILGMRQIWLIFEYFVDYRLFVLLLISVFFVLNSKR